VNVAVCSPAAENATDSVAALAAAAPFTVSMEVKNGKPTYYVCTDGACALPVNL